MKNIFFRIIGIVTGTVFLSHAGLTLDWTNTGALDLGTNFTLNFTISSSGSYSVASVENVPATMTFSVSGTTTIPELYGKSFALTFSSVNGQTFQSHSSTGSFRIGMTGGANRYRFDLPEEVVRITADLLDLTTNEVLRLQSVYNLNAGTNYVIGLRNASGVESRTATNAPGNAIIDVSAVSPVLYGDKKSFFEYRAAEGSAGGWRQLVFEFSSLAEPVPAIRPAHIFSSGCVLQRDRTVKVWGTCQPYEAVTLEVKSQLKNTVADSNGNWQIEIAPEPASGPYTMTITGTDSQSAVLTDIYFGDVWILTGQSNMFQTMASQIPKYSANYPSVPNATDNFDDLRLAIVQNLPNSNAPSADVTMLRTWSRWEANALADMSMAGYFFARFLNEKMDENGLSGVPLGLLKVCRGGTAVEEWISSEKIAALKTANPDLIVAGNASGCYNGMIAPIQDYAIKGTLWYQGESNANRIDQTLQYPLLKRMLIESWREQWNYPDMPFYFVQLAPYHQYSIVPSDELWSKMRESQRSCLTISNTAMACIIDSGLQGEIHPPFKDRVGERLARIVLAKVYGVPLVCRGPTAADVQITGSNVMITFDNVASGLKTATVDCQPDADEVAAGYAPVSVSSNELAGFALCGSNRVFYWATQAEIVSSNQVTISNPADVPMPVAVRYAWQDYPRCNLFNSEGLPAEPFRSDTYEYDTANGADSTPHAAGISNRVLRALATVMEINLSDAFYDLEDGTNALCFSISGSSNSNVISFATISNQVLLLTLAGTAGTSSVTVTAQDSSGNQAKSSFSVMAESSAYKVWRHGYFTETQLGNTGDEATVWGDRADPDGDGLPNLIEYALSQNPREHDGPARPVSIVVENGAIKARFLRSKEAAADASVVIGVQTLKALTRTPEWVALRNNDVLYKDTGDTELRDVTLSSIHDEETQMFVRLYVSRTE